MMPYYKLTDLSVLKLLLISVVIATWFDCIGHMQMPAIIEFIGSGLVGVLGYAALKCLEMVPK